MPYLEQWNAELADQYVWPAARPTLGWTLNRSANAISGVTVRRSGGWAGGLPSDDDGDYPCSGPPFPCDPPGGGAPFMPGRIVPLTLHPCRARNLLEDADTPPNQEVCRHHFGRWTVNARGRLVPVVCSIPEEYPEQRLKVSMGRVTARPAGNRPSSDLLSLARIGRLCFLNTVDLPPTGEMIVDNANPSCDNPD